MAPLWRLAASSEACSRVRHHGIFATLAAPPRMPARLHPCPPPARAAKSAQPHVGVACKRRQHNVADRRRQQRRSADAVGRRLVARLEVGLLLHALHCHLRWCAAHTSRRAAANITSLPHAASVGSDGRRPDSDDGYAVPALRCARHAIDARAATGESHPNACRTAGAMFPSGVIAALSAAMVTFLVYNMLAGGNPPPKKAAKAV